MPHPGVASPPPPSPSPGCGGNPSTSSDFPSTSASPLLPSEPGRSVARHLFDEMPGREIERRERYVRQREVEEKQLEEALISREYGQDMRARGSEYDKVRWNELRQKVEEENKGRTHGCFEAAWLRWNDCRRAVTSDDASTSLTKQLLNPLQSKQMPIPCNTFTPKVYPEGTATTFDALARPYLVECESKDLQMVKISLLVLTRPGENFSERVLPSIIPETMKAVVAQYNGSQLITQRETVSREIRKILTERAGNLSIVFDNVSIISLSVGEEFSHATEGAEQVDAQKVEKDKTSAIIRAQEDDQTWNKRQIGYIFDLGTALFLIFLIRPMLPIGYDRWVLVAFAAIWGLGSIGLPIGLFGTSRFEKNCSRHVGRLISLCLSLLVIYAIYLLALHVDATPASTPSSLLLGANADGVIMALFSTIAALVFCGHLCTWIRGCYTGGDRDREPLDG